MSKVVIFGGTTEGRLLTEYCVNHGMDAVVCVVSEYGRQVLPTDVNLKVLTGPMEEAEMYHLLLEEKPVVVLDATHPYATVVTEHIVEACRKSDMRYVRVSRQMTERQTLDSGTVRWVDDITQAVELLKTSQGSVLVTTGSKGLQAYTELPDYENRLYVRVLPDRDAVALCQQAGICGNHIIAMQGPFSVDMNRAVIRHTGVKILVTKEGGQVGGFQEKLDAAQACGVDVIVIGRPQKPQGISVEEGLELLGDMEKTDGKRIISLIGVGMGNVNQLTGESAEQLLKSEVFLGAKRLLEDLNPSFPHTRKEPYYKSEDVLIWLKAHPGYQRIAVLYSGDTGFYSGAKQMLEALSLPEQDLQFETKVYPGISSVSYLCGKLKVSWEDAYLGSNHGRTVDVVELLKHHKKIFLLLGGEDSVRMLCKELVKHGYGAVKVSVGERLSYPDEQVVTKTAEELRNQVFGALAAVLIRNEAD